MAQICQGCSKYSCVQYRIQDFMDKPVAFFDPDFIQGNQALI